MEQYTQEKEDKFVQELKRNKTKVSTLKSLSNQLQRSQSQYSIKPVKYPEQIMKKRFGKHIHLLKKQINNVEEICDNKFGGSQFVNKELDKNEITQQQYVDYCMQRISKNFQLPKISQRSKSFKVLKNSSNERTERKKQFCYNKWFIDPQERFSKSKEKTKYAWDKETFMYNIVQQKGKVLKHDYLPKFINNSKEILQRQPLLCRYTLINPKR